TELKVQAQLTVQDIALSHARNAFDLISAEHSMALVRVTFSDDLIDGPILTSNGSDPSVTFTDVTIADCDTQGSAAIDLSDSAQAVTMTRVTVQRLNAPAIALDG